MPRRKRNETNHDLFYGRWQMFGEWMTQQRMIVGLTQQQAADAVKRSRRQWIRYELGRAKVPTKLMKGMSKVLHVTEEKMWDRAGYRVSHNHLAPKDRLEKLQDLLSAGRLEMAIIQLLELNDRITGTSAYGPRFGGLVATDYANAVKLLDRLPGPWVESLQEVMKERIHDKDDEIEFLVRGGKLLRRKRIELTLG
jgi:transcriptional regulator with XRE-family HTH domain